MRSRSFQPQRITGLTARSLVSRPIRAMAASVCGAPDARAAAPAALQTEAGCHLYVPVTRKGSLTYETGGDR